MKIKNSFDNIAFHYDGDFFNGFPFEMMGFDDIDVYIKTYLSDLVVFALQDENFDFKSIDKKSINKILDEAAVNVTVNSIYQGKKTYLKCDKV